MKRERQTNNPILRAYGNACSYIGAFFLNQADKYCDLYVLDETFLDLIKDDSTGVWDPNDE